eukprot:m.341633 g.341633  ORF g.341633 m.341633 type:complete len:252 (-) comp20285_c0_seq1:32-787(-)
MKELYSLCKSSDDRVFLVQAAVSAKRYDDGIEVLETTAKELGKLTQSERLLFASVCRKATSLLRSAWKYYSDEGQAATSPLRVKIACALSCTQIEEKLRDKCQRVVEFVDNLLEKSSDDEATIFYHKMKGDHLRYIAEFETGEERKISAGLALVSYKAGLNLATAVLHPSDVVRLGLSLNLAVFYFDILGAPERAIFIGKEAFQEGINNIDSLPCDEKKKPYDILEALRSNVAQWKSLTKSPQDKLKSQED